MLHGRELRDTCLGSATAGMVSRLSCHPLDTAKARLQGPHGGSFKNTAHVLRMTMANEGVPGLYRGIGAVLVGGIPATCLYLTTYEAAKGFLVDKFPGGGTGAVVAGDRGGDGGGGIAIHLTAGMLAEVVCCVVFVPVDVVKERLQVQQPAGKAAMPCLPPSNGEGGAGSGVREGSLPYRGSADTLRTILKVEGLRGIYKGYLATLASFGPFSALYFTFYEQAKAASTQFFAGRQRRPLEGREANLTAAGGGARGGSGDGVDLPVSVTLANAAAAAAAASWLTNPLDLAKLRLQVQRGAAASAGLARAAGPAGAPSARVDGSPAGLYSGMVDALRRCYRAEGLAGLFKGSGARMAFHAPSTAIAMATFETAKHFFGTVLP